MFEWLFGSKKQTVVSTPQRTLQKSDREKIDEKLLRAVGWYWGDMSERVEEQIKSLVDKKREWEASGLTPAEMIERHKEERITESHEKANNIPRYLTNEDFLRLAGELQADGLFVLVTALRERASVLGIPTDRAQMFQYGGINPTAECIFCGVTGGVRVKIKSVTEKYRMNSVAGAALGVGLNAHKDKIQRHCEKCGKTWHD